MALAMRGMRSALEGLPIRYQLVVLAIATAGLAVLSLTAAFIAYPSFFADGRLLSAVIVAALAAAAGIGLATLLRGFITRPVDQLRQTIVELKAATLRAETTSRVKSEFLANMSHELRTPLNAIIGFSDLMQSQTLGPVGNRTYVEYAADIHFSGTHLLEIINDILDVVRYEAGKMELKEEPVAVERAIGEALRLVAPQSAQGEIGLVWTPPEPPLPPLLCDRVRLRQMLLNILSNAIKFTMPGGSVEIRAELAEGLTLAITDTGIGIEPEDITRIMTPFGQVGSVYASAQRGTGLGLTLTKALIEAHGGRLSLDSVAGVGTTVRLAFPAARVIRAPIDSGEPR